MVEIPDVQRQRRPKRPQPLKLSAIDYAELIGWWLAEGSLVPRDRAFTIAQTKESGRAALGALLDRIGFEWHWHSTGVTIYDAAWYEHLAALDVGRSRTKFVPAWLKNATRPVLSALIAGLMGGDGHWYSPTGGTFYSISRRLSDDFADVAFRAGWIVYTSQRQRPDRDGLSYQVNIKRVRSGGTEILTGNHCYDVATRTERRSDIHDVPHDGPVYCIGIDGTHSFVIRQDGCIWVSGNSWVKARFLDHPSTTRRFYLPALISDNPALDAVSYVASLGELDVVTRMRLLHGDWGIKDEGRMFNRDWIERAAA